jgi:hypothetical protein
MTSPPSALPVIRSKHEEQLRPDHVCPGPGYSVHSVLTRIFARSMFPYCSRPSFSRVRLDCGGAAYDTSRSSKNPQPPLISTSLTPTPQG